MIRDDKLRIGIVKYLNSKPLVYGLKEFLPETSFRFDYPNKLSDELAKDLLDVCLVSSIEYFKNPEYQIISNSCVASNGHVLSVKLYSKKQLHEIKTLAVDVASRTSIILARILLLECFGIEPIIHKHQIHSTLESCHADAVLLIGDRALKTLGDEFPVCVDLGELWYRFTGMPFVYACWICKTGQDSNQVIEALEDCRDSGINHLQEIARKESTRLSLNPELAETYLTKNLYYYLGKEELKGLNYFGKLAAKHGFINNFKTHKLSKASFTNGLIQL